MRCILLPILLLTACGSGSDEPSAPDNNLDVPVPSGPPVVQQVDEMEPVAPPTAGPAWESVASGGATAVRLTQLGGNVLMSIACLSGPRRLAVTVPSFTAIGSEDRFSFGIDQEPVTLVADPTEQKQPGVTGEGAVPENFADLIDSAKRISANYGNQQAGPQPAPPEALRDALAKACSA
jgi:hypothetical protein